MIRVVLISTYDMGRQPFALASALAWLRTHTDAQVDVMDLDIDPMQKELLEQADLAAFYLPMHTATRLALPLLEEVRAINPSIRLCGFGLYAPLNAQPLRERGIEFILGNAFEQELVAVVNGLENADGPEPGGGRETADGGRQVFLVPDRSGLPALERYARLVDAPGASKTVGVTESTRGCKHRCRHCPVVPVYQGRFDVIQREVVLADIAQQVAMGAEHITFGDPDFFNGPAHGMAVVEALHTAHPGLSYDVTIKVEHLLKQRRHLERLRATGCLFITTAVESLDDEVLALLDKGHSHRDFREALELCRAAGLTLCPTFIAFMPWTTREGYLHLLEGVEDLGLVDFVPPIQLALRLLITASSPLLELESVRRVIGPFDSDKLVYPWQSPHEGMEELAERAMGIVQEGVTSGLPRPEIFARLHDLARLHDTAPEPGPDFPAVPIHPPVAAPPFVPHLTENWFC